MANKTKQNFEVYISLNKHYCGHNGIHNTFAVFFDQINSVSSSCFAYCFLFLILIFLF